MRLDLLEERAAATALGVNPSLATALFTFSLVRGLTPSYPFSTLDTVDIATPASAATSLIVTIVSPYISMEKRPENVMEIVFYTDNKIHPFKCQGIFGKRFSCVKTGFSCAYPHFLLLFRYVLGVLIKETMGYG